MSLFKPRNPGSSSRMSRRIAKLNNKQSVLNKKLDISNTKANIKFAKSGGNVQLNKGKVTAGLLGGVLASKFLLNTKAMNDQRDMFNNWMKSLEKREADKNKDKASKKKGDDNYEE